MKRTWIGCLCAGLLATLATTAFAEQVDNPAYAAWAQYKPGTSVTHKSSTKMEMPGMPGAGREMTSTTTQKLIEVKPDAVTVEVTMEMAGPGMPPGMPKQPARQVKIPAKIDKDKEGMPDLPPGAEKPEIKDMKVGKDTVEVNGKKVDAVTREFSMVMKPQGMEMNSHVKTWYATEVPGGLVKMENEMTGQMTMHMKQELSEYHIEK